MPKNKTYSFSSFSSIRVVLCVIFTCKVKPFDILSFQMFQKNSTLKRLYLTHNQFEEKAAFHFKEALSHNESLELLDISWNHFRTHGAVAIAEGVQVRQ